MKCGNLFEFFNIADFGGNDNNEHEGEYDNDNDNDNGDVDENGFTLY